MKTLKFIIAPLFLLVAFFSNLSAIAQSTENHLSDVFGVQYIQTNDELLLQLYVDKGAYNTGEDIQMSGLLSMNGYPISGAQVCYQLDNDYNAAPWGACGMTDSEGKFYETLTYGWAIPEGYVGYLLLSATAEYDDEEAYSEMSIPYGLGDNDDDEEILGLALYTREGNVYMQGDDIVVFTEVFYNGEPLVDGLVCPTVFDKQDNTIYDACLYTDRDGFISFKLEYGKHIPIDYLGEIEVFVSVEYERYLAEDNMTLEYIKAINDDQALELELWGPSAPIQIGGWDVIQIGGTVTSQGMDVNDAVVTISVAGGTYQTTTGMVESGKFYYGWHNDAFPAGEYIVRVTVEKPGYQSVSGTIPFTVFGGDYDFAAVMDPIQSFYEPAFNVPFPGTLTLGGKPVSDWIEIDVTYPDGHKEAFSNMSDENGRFTHTVQNMMAHGTYQLVVFYRSDRKQISPVYTFTVGTAITPTATPDSPPTAESSLICEIVDVVYPQVVAVGDSVTVTGRVVCMVGDNGEEIFPQEGWEVKVFDMHSTFKAPLVRTDGSGVFATTFTPRIFMQDLTIFAQNPEIEYYAGNRSAFADWYGPFKVVAGIDPEITFSQTDYDQGEVLVGELRLNPNYPAEDWESGLEIYYMITGPEGDAPRQYLFESQYDYVDPRYNYDNIIDRFTWVVPPDAGEGKYTVTAYISGAHIATQVVEADFYVTDMEYTNLTAVVESDPDGWVSATLVGQYTDFQGVPIPDADVRVEFMLVDWNEERTEVIGFRDFELKGVTDEFGVYKIDLEPLDLFAGQGQSSPWEPYDATTTIYADKDGYATGATMIKVRIPTVKARIEIISIDPPLDYLSKKTESGMSYEQLTNMDIQVRVRYNNIFEEGAKLSIKAMGNWAVTCSETENHWTTYDVHLEVNGQKPEWEGSYPTYGDLLTKDQKTWPRYGKMLTWPSWEPYIVWYWYPEHSVIMPASHGIAQESTISVSGELFGYTYDENSPNQCGWSSYGTDTPSIPPPWVPVRPVVKIIVGMGDAKAVAVYNATLPSISVDGEAWVSLTGGEFNGKLGMGQATGFPLSNKTVNLAIIAKDALTGEESPTSEITIQPSAKTDDKGNLELPLVAKTNPCELELEANYYVKVTSSALGGEKLIPIELRCIEDLKFNLTEGSIALVQAVDITEDPQHRLAAGKEAGVRVNLEVDGEIFQPKNKPAAFKVRFELVRNNSTAPLIPQEKIVSITEKGASVRWAGSTNAINKAGIGDVVTWKTKPTGVTGTEIIPLDFVFTPPSPSGKDGGYTIRIIIDPDGVHGEKLVQEIPVQIHNMKTLRLIVVPVDIDNIDMGFVSKQVNFLFQTYPLGLSNLIIDFRPEPYNTSSIPASCTSLTHLKQIACGLGSAIGVGGDANYETRIIGVVNELTWLEERDPVLYWAGAIGAVGSYSPERWDSTTNNVVLVRYPENVLNTTAHEIGHTYGLELQEQYITNPPNGLPVSGLVLKEGQIFDIPSDYKATKAMGPAANWQKIGYRGASAIYDLMGSAGYYLAQNGEDLVFEEMQQSWVVYKTWHSLFNALKDPPGEEIFFVQGVIGMDGLVSLNPLVQMEGVPDAQVDEGDYEVQFLDSSGNVLYSKHFGDSTKPGLFDLRGPYTPGTAHLVVLLDGSIVGELNRTPFPPEISSLQLSGVNTEDNTMNIRWVGNDPDENALVYSLHYRCNGSVWVPLAANLTEQTYTVNLAYMSGEECTIRVTASDGMNSVSAISESFATLPQAPTVSILTKQVTFSADEPVLLEGRAYNLTEGIIPDAQLTWFSDRDGELGTGSTLNVTLSPGVHNLTLRAQDSIGNTSEAQATIEVKNVLYDGDEPLTGMGSGLYSLWFIGCLGFAAFLGVVTLFITWLALRKPRQPAPAAVQSNPQDLSRPIQDAQGRWWYQDPRSGTWSIWNGEAWQPASGSGPVNLHNQRIVSTVEEKRSDRSWLISLLVSGAIALIVFMGISLVAFDFFPSYQFEVGSGDLTQFLKMGGGGLLIAVLGVLLLHGGFKAVITRQLTTYDEMDRQREKRGCSAILGGLGQLFFGVMLLVGGVGLITVALYQELLPWLFL